MPSSETYASRAQNNLRGAVAFGVAGSITALAATGFIMASRQSGNNLSDIMTAEPYVVPILAAATVLSALGYSHQSGQMRKNDLRALEV